jgi:hypothetical protein
MEPAKILFQASDDQRLVSTASQSTLNLFTHHEILGIEHVCVDHFKRAARGRERLLIGAREIEEACRHLDFVSNALRGDLRKMARERVIEFAQDSRLVRGPRHTIELSRDGPRSRHSPRIRQRRRCKRIAEPNPRRSWEAVTPSRLDQQPAVLRGTESLLTLCWRKMDSNF